VAWRALYDGVTHRLYLLRHAKSSWDEPGLADHDRPLAKRGRRAADAMARHLRENEVAPELVLCSTARRARETFERIEPALEAPEVRFERELYGATPHGLLERLQRVPDSVASVMVVGHNPTLEELALDLARPSPARRELEAKFPTGALATLELPGSWGDLDEAELVAFVRPRDLTHN
jgi:phosphohistidine phosphatase